MMDDRRRWTGRAERNNNALAAVISASCSSVWCTIWRKQEQKEEDEEEWECGQKEWNRPELNDLHSMLLSVGSPHRISFAHYKHSIFRGEFLGTSASRRGCGHRWKEGGQWMRRLKENILGQIIESLCPVNWKTTRWVPSPVDPDYGI